MAKHQYWMTHEEYLKSDVWKCDKSPTGAHHWREIEKGGSAILFLCKWCLDVKEFPARFAWPKRLPTQRRKGWKILDKLSDSH